MNVAVQQITCKETQQSQHAPYMWVLRTGPTGPSGTSVGSNGTFVVGASSTVIANIGSVVYVNDGAQLVDNRTANTTFSLLGM
jgi:hypothetical protein